MIAYFFSVVGCFAAIAAVTWLLMLALDALHRHFDRSEWRELTLVSTSPEGCRVCGVAGMHAMDCARSGLDGAA